MDDQDAVFFLEHPDRQSRIRLPIMGNVEVNRRGNKVLHLAEEDLAFRSLGDHDPGRRRILVWRVPKNNPAYDPKMPKLMKVPFLAFADDSIEDDDATLLPILHAIMLEARSKVSDV